MWFWLLISFNESFLPNSLLFQSIKAFWNFLTVSLHGEVFQTSMFVVDSKTQFDYFGKLVNKRKGKTGSCCWVDKSPCFITLWRKCFSEIFNRQTQNPLHALFIILILENVSDFPRHGGINIGYFSPNKFLSSERVTWHYYLGKTAHRSSLTISFLGKPTLPTLYKLQSRP